MKKKSLSQVLNEFRIAHGEKYDYSKVVYKSSSEKVKIVCKKHGVFEQSPISHKKGIGCKKCGYEKNANSSKKTKKQFIDEAINVHGKKYDYSKVEYKSAHKPVIIICKKHGEFTQAAHSHLKGSGCLICSGKQKLSTVDFIEKSKLVHGNRYDYSQTKYKDSNTKVKIICKKHGIFKMKPVNHYLLKSNCPKCSYIERGQKRLLTNDKIISEFINKHGYRYDYSLIQYKDSNTKVKIICKEHGIFKMLPINHIYGQGCSKCGTNRTAQELKLSLNEVINNFKKIHGNRYDYSKTEYKNSKSKMIIICKRHGEFLQSYTSHYHRKSNCPKCSKEYIDSLQIKRRTTLKDYIALANDIHNYKYTYNNAVYKGMTKNITITCSKHGDFENRAGNHIHNKIGCPICAEEFLKELQINNRTDEITLKKQIFNIHREFVELVDYSEYRSTDSPLSFKCGKNQKHGIWRSTAHSVLSGTGCPICKMSKGERRVLFWLRDNNIKHFWQHRMKKHIGKGSFIYDFYLPDKKIIIEYDGRQHFYPVDIWGGEKAFKSIQKIDKLKNQHSRLLGFKMIRIAYTIIDIEDFLNKEIG